jgi:hypothetical protein
VGRCGKEAAILRQQLQCVVVVKAGICANTESLFLDHYLTIQLIESRFD